MKKVLFIVFLFAFLFIGYTISVTPSYDSIDISSSLELVQKTLKSNQEIVVIKSKNPFNFYDIFNRIVDISEQDVFGILSKPDSIGKYPLIIGVAGSDGWGTHNYGYLERYLEMGFAVFSLHSFKVGMLNQLWVNSYQLPFRWLYMMHLWHLIHCLMIKILILKKLALLDGV